MPTEPSRPLARGGNWLTHIPSGLLQGQLLSARLTSIHRASGKRLKTPFSPQKSEITTTQCNCSDCSLDDSESGDCHSVELNVSDFCNHSSSSQQLVEHLDRINTQSQPVGHLTPTKFQHLTRDQQSVSSFPILENRLTTAQFKNRRLVNRLKGHLKSSQSNCTPFEQTDLLTDDRHALPTLSINSTFPFISKPSSLQVFKQPQSSTTPSSLNLVPKNAK